MTTVKILPLLELKEDIKEKIKDLLIEVFHDFPYPQRHYYKQEPHYVALVVKGSDLIAYCGLDARIMRINDAPQKVLGLIDLGVKAPYRQKGIAGELLEAITTFAAERSMDYLMLFADNPALYLANGFQRAAPETTWLMIDEHKTLGVKTQIVPECMYKRLHGKLDELKTLDMLGYLY